MGVGVFGKIEYWKDGCLGTGADTGGGGGHSPPLTDSGRGFSIACLRERNPSAKISVLINYVWKVKNLVF